MAKQKENNGEQEQETESKRPKRDRMAELEKRVTALERKLGRVAP